jgi:hypothetical protein
LLETSRLPRDRRNLGARAFGVTRACD